MDNPAVHRRSTGCPARVDIEIQGSSSGVYIGVGKHPLRQGCDECTTNKGCTGETMHMVRI